jgi:hypothetical protein
VRQIGLLIHPRHQFLMDPRGLKLRRKIDLGQLHLKMRRGHFRKQPARIAQPL